MHLDITGNHLELTSAIRSFIEKKVAALQKHMPRETLYIHVMLESEGGLKKAEAVIRGSVHLFAAARHTDLYHAIDMLINKLQRQQLRNKGRRRRPTTRYN